MEIEIIEKDIADNNSKLQRQKTTDVDETTEYIKMLGSEVLQRSHH